jgi:ATP-dependent Clp protease protease subunit
MEYQISLFGNVGEQFTAEDVNKELINAKQNGATRIRVLLNSFGGSVYDGEAQYALFATSNIPVDFEIVGQSFSAASYIMQSARQTGGKIYANSISRVLIHEASGGVWGKANDHEKAAEQLREMSDKIFNIYVNNISSAKRTPENLAKLKEAFDSDKELTATEALELGLIDEVVESLKAVAIYNQNNIKMSENKEAKTLLDEIKSWFTGVKAEAAPQATEETAEQLKEKITALEGELATLKGEKEAKDAEVATLTAEVEALNTLKTGFEAKIKEVENLIAGEKSPENGKKPEGKEVPEFLKGESVSDKMKRLDAENRKRYNS